MENIKWHEPLLYKLELSEKDIYDIRDAPYSNAPRVLKKGKCQHQSIVVELLDWQKTVSFNIEDEAPQGEWSFSGGTGTPVETITIERKNLSALLEEIKSVIEKYS